MNSFIKRVLFFFLVFFIIIELFARIVLDPVYFATIDTYNLPSKGLSKIFGVEKTPEVDYLFIGSSRVPAAINANVFMEKDSGSVAIVAGRGYTTPEIHYRAIKNRLKKFPDYLKNTVVFLEYPNAPIYTNLFEEDEFKVFESEQTKQESMAHLLLPHLDFQSFLNFLVKSENSFGVRMEMIPLYFFSSYRTIFFVNERWGRLDKPIFKDKSSKLSDDGGIRGDRIEQANQLAIEMADQTRQSISEAPPLTFHALKQSSLAYLSELVSENGGKLILFQMPMHSMQIDVYDNEKSIKDILIFELWLKQNNIPLLKIHDFNYSDKDFPDTWHLGRDKRDEFTKELFTVYQNHCTITKDE